MREKISVDELMSSLGPRITQYRDARGISARAMSIQLGRNTNYMNMIECGKSKPSFQGFLEICEFLCISPALFFPTSDWMDSQYRSILDLSYLLTEEQIDLILAVAHQMIQSHS